MALINGSIFNDNNTVDDSGILRPALIGDLRGFAEADTINADRGNDILQGLGGNDLLRGGDGIDLLEGGDGNDDIAGDKGNDTMIGGAGDDTLRWVDGDGSDVMQGGSGRDTVTFSGASTITQPNGVRVPAADVLTLTRASSGTDVILRRTNPTPITLTLSDVEVIDIAGNEGNDSLTVGSLIGTTISAINFRGGEGNDFLDARNDGRATMNASGGFGNDVLLSSNQSDILNGGAGNDNLFGNNGNDTLTGADVDGFSLGRGEVDSLIGGAGRDKFILGDRGGVTGPGRDGRRIFYDDGDNNFDGGNNVFTGMDGVSDFAQIIDFVSGLDTIQLAGTANQYVIRPVDGVLSGGLRAQDVGIFKARPNLFAPDELIAVVRDVGANTLNLNNRSQFTFV